MLLVDPGIIVTQLAYESMHDIEAVLTAGVRAAEPYLATVIGSPFERTTQVDTFFVTDTGFSGQQGQYTPFRLARGFLTSVTSMLYGPYAATIATEGTSSLASAVITPSSLEEGVIKDFVTNYDGQYVRIGYTCGFTADPQNAALYDQTQVPTWLQEAAKLYAMIQAASSAVLKTSDIVLDVTSLKMQLSGIIRGKVRYSPASLIPL